MSDPSITTENTNKAILNAPLLSPRPNRMLRRAISTAPITPAKKVAAKIVPATFRPELSWNGTCLRGPLPGSV